MTLEGRDGRCVMEGGLSYRLDNACHLWERENTNWGEE